MKLQDKTAMITGAGSGMGKEMALLFGREGAKLVLADISREALDQVVSEIKSGGGSAVGVTANVASEDDVQNMIDKAVKEFGSLDILVNNAGIMDKMTPLTDLTDELWQRVLGVNLDGPMRAIRKALPIMIKQGHGSIINITSLSGLYGSRAGAAYTASKHALVGLTKNVGFQYAEMGIRCNAIAPGGVETSILTGPGQIDTEAFGFKRVMSGSNNAPRNGKASEIAAVALFLASDDASFVNGTVVTADGGWTAY